VRRLAGAAAAGALLAGALGGCVVGESGVIATVTCHVFAAGPASEGDDLCDYTRDRALAGTGRQPVTFEVRGRGTVAKRPRVHLGDGRGRATGMEHRGTLTIKTDRASRAQVRGFTRGRFRSRTAIRSGGRDGPGRIVSWLGVDFGRRGSLCMRIDGVLISPDPAAQLYFRSQGGRGRAARVRVNGQGPVDGAATAMRGGATVTRGRPRAPARACRRLLALARKRA
jgi:hypothetical protein